MSFFPYETVSGFFGAEGDFPENQEPDALDLQREDARNLELDLLLTEREDYPGQVAYEAAEPCCYNSSRNFGTGEHEYDCPNY